MNDWARYCNTKPVVRTKDKGNVVVAIGGGR